MARPHRHTQPRHAPFPDGVWNHEPDVAEWQVCGIECCVMRHSGMGHLCGYVRIPAEHAMYHATDIDDLVSVHGDLSYDERDGNDDRWIGFDCAHQSDVVPAIPSDGNRTYRDIHFVQNETARLARQVVINHLIDRALGGL